MVSKSVLDLVSPGGRGGRLSILIFHRVLAEPDPLLPDEPDVLRFDALMRWTADLFNVLPLDRAVEGLRTGALPPRAAVITFDDGYANGLDFALPVLQRYGLSATFFVAAAFLDGSLMWNDVLIEAIRHAPGPWLETGLPGIGRARVGTIEEKRALLAHLLSTVAMLPLPERGKIVAAITRASGAPLPRNLMLNPEQLRLLRARGMLIGAHTLNHPSLLACSDGEAEAEIRAGREILEAALGEAVRFFAYPYGKPDKDYGARHVEMVKRLGFEAALSTVWGSNSRATDPWQLVRFTPWDRSKWRFGLRMFANLRRRAPAAPFTSAIGDRFTPVSSPHIPAARPRVSVIVPAYNASAHVLEALDSVMAQHCAPVEILLIDDGSTDGTAELVEHRMPQVIVIRQANAGVAAARNTGLRHATGEFICFLDADDGWYPGKLAAQLAHLGNHPGTGAVFHGWRVWWPEADGRYAPLPWQPPADPAQIDPGQSGWIYPQLLLGYIMHTSTLMIRREWIEQAGLFRTDLVVGEDYDYWLRLSRLTRIDKLAGVYSFYRRGLQTSLIASAVRPIDYGYELVCDAVERWGLAAPDGSALSRAQLERRLGELAFDFAYGHFHRGSPRLARQASWRAFRHDPRRWKALAYILASLFRIT